MHITWQVAPVSDWEADAILFFVFEGSAQPSRSGFDGWIREHADWLTKTIELGDFQGKPDQVALFYAPSGSRIPRIVCVGLGPIEKFDLDRWRSAAASAFRRCRDWQLKRPAIALCALEGVPFEPASLAMEEALLGAMLGLYRYEGLKTKDGEHPVEPRELILLTESEPDEALSAAVSTAKAIASGARLARDLTAAPSNQVTASFLAKTAGQLAGRYGFRLKEIDYEEAGSLGMGAFRAVAKGSREPAYVIILEHAPPEVEEEAPLVFVGKGITFDSGGISLKPADRMEAMKQDMAGAAAVLGTFDALGQLNIKRHVIGILPCTENMPGGQAYKPGDVVRTLSGLSVEIISTDAEGRLILADALAYAGRYKPAAVVDIATLTGACITALGSRVSGLMGNSDALSGAIQKIGMEVGEKLWILPLWDLYLEALKSDVADFKNVGDRRGGAIVAGAFLKQFVPGDTPWAHLDIAGPAWSDKDVSLYPKGATGFGVRIFVELIRRWPNLQLK